MTERINTRPHQCAAVSDIVRYQHMLNRAELVNSRLRSENTQLRNNVTLWRTWCIAVVVVAVFMAGVLLMK